jgi:hemoglobin
MTSSPAPIDPAPDARRAAAPHRIEAETGIDEAMIARLVDGFYDRVRQDALIGPVFADRISDWGPHLAQMKRFWSSIVLASGTYQGRPMPKHLPLPVDGRHFDRWLELFRATARDVCPAAAADLVIQRAERIGESFELAIAGANGVLLRKGERFVRPTEAWVPPPHRP